MYLSTLYKKTFSILILFFGLIFSTYSQTTTVGSASYTTAFPGTDEAGRNSFPPGVPQLSGNALNKPAPTNDWWSLLLRDPHVSNLFNYPMALKTTNNGLVTSYIPWGVFDDQKPIVIGVDGLNAPEATVSDHTAWTVTIDFNDGTHQFDVTAGIAMPFLYFTKSSNDLAKVTINLGTVTVKDEVIIVTDARNGADFVIFAPQGSTWEQEGNVYTSSLNEKDYWSMAMLPQEAEDIDALAEAYQAYAYVFPQNTMANWAYNENTGEVRTDFVVETVVKEGENTDMLIGLLPHQWDNLAGDSPQPDLHSYSSVRGEIKTMAGNGFSVVNTFFGILPTMPYLANYSEGFSPAELAQKIEEIENEGLAAWTDSYNEGQVMNRLIQTARIADQTGDLEARDKMIATVKERLEDWLSYEASEVAFLFYYHEEWSAMLGYPGGHGQDSNINDHHFHWGYFIHAAAFMEQFEPGWADQWGEMINILIRDAASPNRNDELFPFLRNFSPYAGHAWANGLATFPQGNDQESTSESMQFNSSLIHWGSITGNDEIRDLGIYLYTTEQTAIEEYWFDQNERNFGENQQYSLVSRVWGNSYDNQTFWTADITASYVIEMYPIHGGSLYLGHNQAYAAKIWEELQQYTGILNNQDNNPNLWHDVIWKYLSLINPSEAIALYNERPDRVLKFGVSDAQTYHWLHSINSMGTVRTDITANHPIAAAFLKDGKTTYVAHNYGEQPIQVLFSDGYILDVSAKQMATSRDIDASGEITSDFNQAYKEGSVNLSVAVEGDGISKVEFLDGNEVIGEVSAPPYELRANELSLGVHGFYSRIYKNEEFVVSNTVSVQVGEQLPYGGKASDIPGVIEAGHFDTYEGGSGQGISYVDVTSTNEGNFRTDESVGVYQSNTEGATLGWIAPGEWVEFTVDVEQPGYYDLEFRYASANQSGRGPFYLELDGEMITSDIEVPFTNGWDNWATKNVAGIPFSSGRHILRVYFKGGEFNLGKMNFSFSADLDYSQPVANAGENVIVILPEVTTQLDGSASADPEEGALDFNWTQVYGPSKVVFSDQAIANPSISNLEKGVYLLRLIVENGSHSDSDELYVFVDESGSFKPFISIMAPEDNRTFIEGQEVEIKTSASDVDGTVTQIEIFLDQTSIATLTAEPFNTTWTAELGEYELTAVATDNNGLTTTSEIVGIEVREAPPCSGESPNGDYYYEFSEDNENPTLRFIPSASGVGDPTCILYYKTDASEDFAGYNVDPYMPFQLDAPAGSIVTFYYTYSFPGQGERNNSQDPIHYVVGTCVAEEYTLSLDNESFTIDENSPRGTTVGTLEADYSGNDQLVYRIMGGNENNAFSINSSNGIIQVENEEAIDFETTPTFELSVEVTAGELIADATIMISLNDLDDVITSLEKARINGIDLYPNPVESRLVLRSNNTNSFEVKDILNAQGQSQEFKITVDNEEVHIDFSLLPTGLYLIIIEQSDQKYQLKVIKR